MTASLEEIRKEFWEAWNGLSQVHTQEDLESQSEKMWAARKRLMKVDPEFRAMIKDREDQAKEDADARRVQIEAKHKQIISEAEKEVAAAKTKAATAMRMTDADLDAWAQKHRVKAVTLKETKTKSKRVCPICLEPDRGNLVNGEPTCISCMHITVPEGELKNYNREYRRKWKRHRKRARLEN